MMTNSMFRFYEKIPAGIPHLYDIDFVIKTFYSVILNSFDSKFVDILIRFFKISFECDTSFAMTHRVRR